MKILSFLSGVLVLVGGAFVDTASGQAVQVKNDPSYPLQIVSVSPDIRDGRKTIAGAKISMRNTGKVQCIALAVTVVVRFSNSEARRINVSQDYAALGYGPNGNGIGPGELYDRVSQSHMTAPQNATIASLEASVDYVEMADGTTYGSDPDHVQRFFGTLRAARQAERKRLLGVYDQKGFNELLNELRRH